MNKKVIFNTWCGAFFNPGGGEVQLLNTKAHMEKVGWTVELYNQWNPNSDAPIFHHFSIRAGSEFPMEGYRRLGKKIALSTILWVEYTKGTAPYDYVRKIFNLADILLTNSDAESEKLSRAFDIDPGKFHKTRNSVSEAYLDRKTDKNFRDEYRIDSDFILSVANIDRRKNTHALVEACKRLGKKLVLIGHIRDQAYYDELKDSDPNMRFLGPVSDTGLLKSAFQSCDLFALPSLCETPGIAALEAASQGAKVVITNEGPTEEYFGELVTYVDPHSPDSIAQGIETEARQKRDLQRLRKHIVSNYTWDKTAQDVIAGYSTLLNLPA